MFGDRHAWGQALTTNVTANRKKVCAVTHTAPLGGCAPGVAGMAAITALAGEGYTEVVPAFVTAGAGKARPAESPNL